MRKTGRTGREQTEEGVLTKGNGRISQIILESKNEHSIILFS
jgi:hypothetical protein